MTKIKDIKGFKENAPGKKDQSSFGVDPDTFFKNLGSNSCHDQFSSLEVSVDEEALAAILWKLQNPDKEHEFAVAGWQELYRDQAKSLAAQAHKFLVLRKESV